MKPARTVRAILSTAACTLILAATMTACGGSGSHDNSGSQAPSGGASTSTGAAPSPSLKIADSAVGPVLTDASGHTLYAFAKDKDATSTCTGPCIATWPAFTTKGTVGGGSGLNSSLLGTIQRTDGVTQASYNKWPLYYYAGDTAPGTINGQGVDRVWFVVNPQGKLVKSGTSGPSDSWQSVSTG